MFVKLLTKIATLNTLYLVSLLFLVIIFCYGNTLHNGLFFDDEQFIYTNQSVTSFDIGKLFERSLTTGAGKLSNYYRPLLFLGFSFEYHLVKDTGFLYHFDSFMLHFTGSVILFLLLKKIFKNKNIALLTALLFLVHPIQTEAVSYASGRGDPLSFLFIMLTLYLALSKKSLSLIISFLTLISALLSKEIALMTPGLIFITILFYENSFSKKAFIHAFLKTLPYALITGGYFLLRLTVLNFDNTLNFYNGTNIYTKSLFVRLSTFFNLFPSYLGLLIYPKTLFMERDSGIQIVTKPTVQALGSILGILILLIISLWKKKTSPILLYSLLWIGIAFIPTSGILPINGIFYEHFLYFPSVGFFLLFSFAVSKLWQKMHPLGKETLAFLLILMILALSLRTIKRNRDWHDPITFYNQTLEHVQSPRALNNLAMAYATEGNNKAAISTYKKAIKLVDAYPESHYNLANTYAALNDYSDAEKEYRNALKIDPSFYLSYIKLYPLYKASNNKAGLNFVHNGLTNLAKYNPQFLNLLQQLENH